MWLLFVLACVPNRVEGTVTGLFVPIESAYLTIEPAAFGEDDLVLATMSSLPNSCAVQQFWLELEAEAQTPEELAAAWAAAWPETFWQVDIVVRKSAGSWPQPGSLWAGLAWDAFPELAGQTFLTVNQHIAHRDEPWFSGAGVEEDAYEHVFYSDAGALQWKRGVPGQRAHGKFNTNLTDGSGASVGQVQVFFDTAPCPLVGAP